MSSKLDQGQIFQDIHDDSNDAINVKLIGGTFVSEKYDALSKENTSATVETFRYYFGGLSGTLVATVVVTYVDATKDDIVSVERS